MPRLTTEQVRALAEREARRNLLPDSAIALLAALWWHESAWNSTAESSVARGLGQLKRGAASDMGLRWEDAFDASLNARASAKYLTRQLINFSGSVLLALAAYRVGGGRTRQVGLTGPGASYARAVVSLLTEPRITSITAAAQRLA